MPRLAYLDASCGRPRRGTTPRRSRQRLARTLVRAGERADALGAAAEARRYLEQAADLADEPAERGELLARAGWHAFYAADLEAAERLLTRALAEFESTVDIRGRGAAMRKLGQVLWRRGRHDEAIAITEAALAAVPPGVADEERAAIASSLGLALVFTGDHERAEELLTLALDLSESLGAVDVTSRVLQGKGIIASAKGHPEEALALTKHGLTIALDHEDWERVYNLYFNLWDLTVPGRPLRGGARLPRGRSGRHAEARVTTGRVVRPCRDVASARDARPLGGGARERGTDPRGEPGRCADDEPAYVGARDPPQPWRSRRGTTTARVVRASRRGDGTSRIERDGTPLARQCCVRRASSRRLSRPVLEEQGEVAMTSFGPRGQSVKQGFVEAIEAALALGERGRAEELLGKIETIPPGLRAPYVAAQADRFRARLAGESEPASAAFEAAAARFREIAAPFWLGITCLEHGRVAPRERAARRRCSSARRGAAPPRATCGDTVARPALTSGGHARPNDGDGVNCPSCGALAAGIPAEVALSDSPADRLAGNPRRLGVPVAAARAALGPGGAARRRHAELLL